MLGLQFSIRVMLIGTAVVATLCWVAACAVMGQTWAIALLLTVLALVVWALGQVMLFAVAALASTIFSVTQRKTLTSPFANETPAPQILPTDHHVAD
ncbi:hypothetical protein LOC68_02980 [Blastopirellula sp. JC732]|uniref:Uncharacterized protein n=1 Tax=Blastopirellula sediminis TaxID=2894196 RepID=A0A9X1MHS0_9BACT|nr:hypothetical protein [Blastopirellula sediminis]MCC9607859.1 hypothetical protein [Blastopirellula sediminis]MCC9627348.1 hypothetical protein [Blastopirellula sediminis]